MSESLKEIHGYIYGESVLQSTIKKVKLMSKIRWRSFFQRIRNG